MSSSDHDLLETLEIGGSYLELIEFHVDRALPNGEILQGRYGVNVAKVREVVRMPVITPHGVTEQGVAGIFELRGVPIPAVNLAVVLGHKQAKLLPEQQIIVVEFSNRRAGFIVSATKRIRRIPWDRVLAPPNDKSSFVTGMILLEENEFLFILDMEKILNELDNKPLVKESDGQSITIEDLIRLGLGGPKNPVVEAKVNASHRILVVDDSPLILDAVRSTFAKAGYRVDTACDGLAALELLDQSTDEASGIDLIVTDVEMPRMDGITLVKKIREHALLSHLPIVFHSSLSGDATVRAGQAAGADGYVVKNDFKALLEMARRFLKSNDVSFAS